MVINKSDLLAFKDEVLAEQSVLVSEFENVKIQNAEKVKAFAESLQKETQDKYIIQLATIDGKVAAIDALIEKTPEIDSGVDDDSPF